MTDFYSLFNEKNVLITGGVGYIATWLKNKIERFCNKVIVIDKNIKNEKENYYYVDITNKNSIDKILKQSRFDYIFHFAALISVYQSIKSPYSHFNVNSFGTLNLAESVRQYQDKAKIIFNSTGLVYGNPKELPITINHPLSPNTPYAASKAAAEDILSSYSRTYGIKVSVLRLFNVYGKNQKPPLFIPSFIHRCLNDKQIKVGNINTSRDFIYITDAIEAILRAAVYSKKSLSYYNIASGLEYKISDVIEIILQLTNRNKNDLFIDPELIRPKESEIERIKVNIFETKNELSWSPKIDLVDGLKQCVLAAKKENQKKI